MDEEIKRRFEEIEKRLEIIEGKKIKTIPKVKSDFSGISKGINDLIQDGFFDVPKSVDETIPELSRRGFFGEKQKIDSSIRKTFFGTKKILDRLKEGSSWKYFKRK